MTPDRVEGERRAGELVAGMLASPCERLPNLPALVAVAEQRRWLRRRVDQLTSALDADDLRCCRMRAKIGVLVHYGYLSADGERAVTEKDASRAKSARRLTSWYWRSSFLRRARRARGE